VSASLRLPVRACPHADRCRDVQAGSEPYLWYGSMSDILIEPIEITVQTSLSES